MSQDRSVDAELDPQTRAFYCRAIATLSESNIPFLVGGAYALAHYTRIVRHTKDFDIFVRHADFERILDLFSAAGYQTEITYPHWLGKVLWETENIDVIFNSGNGVAKVDDRWFERAARGDVLGMSLGICPAEEIIWSKATIMSRERYDGADVAHLLYAQGQHLNWQHLLERFGANWRVLFSHLVLFGFIYPAERSQIPAWVMHELTGRLQRELNQSVPAERICRGTLLSWDQYLVDVEQRGYHDGRVMPSGTLTVDDVAHMTAVLQGTKPVEPRPPTLPVENPGVTGRSAQS